MLKAEGVIEKRALLVGLAAVGLIVLQAPAQAADTLRDALASTYQTNPVLNARREALRGTDASVALALSQSRPQLAATVGINRDLTRSGILETGRSRGPILSGGVDLNLPLFLGGRVRNSVEAARARVEAGRAALKAAEGAVFVEAVTVYMDVMRDRAIVELNANQVKVLEANLKSTNALFASGDLTRTDIAQSEARLSAARGQLLLAEARLTASMENYLRVVGRRADTLSPPPPLPPMPASANEAVRLAMARNPSLTAALQQARAAGLDVRVAQADRLPSLSGVVGGDYVNYVRDNNGVGIPRSGTQTTVGLTTRIPLYQGGAPAARIRQAQAAQGQLMEETIAAERAVVADARSAFASFEASTRAIATGEAEVAANELALRGARAERRVGTRTVIEVLNAEQELLTSQVRLISARRDAYVAGFRLLEVLGQASSESLGLESGPLYDPQGNYRKVAGEWSDWAGEALARPRSTSTLKLAEAAPIPAEEADARLAGREAPLQSAQVQPEAPVATATPLVADQTAPSSPDAEKAPVLADAAPLPVADNVSAPMSSSQGWMVQLGAFRRPGAPEAHFARLSPKLAGMQPTYVPAGPVTRVLVGPFSSRSLADSACEQVRQVSGCQVVRRR